MVGMKFFCQRNRFGFAAIDALGVKRRFRLVLQRLDLQPTGKCGMGSPQFGLDCIGDRNFTEKAGQQIDLADRQESRQR